jgi:hypothetical protein
MTKAKKLTASISASGACAGTVLAISAPSPAKAPELVLMGVVESMLEECVFGAIEEICKEKNVITKENKEAESGEYTTFALDYLYKHLLEEQLLESARIHADSKLKHKKKPTSKDIVEANFLNFKIKLNFVDGDLERLVGWCRSEKQLKFWKMLWFSWLARANLNLKLRGVTGSISFPRDFYKRAEVLYELTHAEGYVKPSEDKSDDDNETPDSDGIEA